MLMIALLLAAGLLHPPVLGPQILSAPQPPAASMSQPAVSAAPATGGATIAWAADDHVYIALLSLEGRIAPQLTELQASQPTPPSIVPFRGGYLVAWSNLALPEQAVLVKLSQDLRPIAETRMPGRSSEVRSDGTFAWLLVDGNGFPVSDDGGGLALGGRAFACDDVAVVGNALPPRVSHEEQSCGGHFNFCPPGLYAVSIAWRNTIQQIPTGTNTFPASLAFDGRTLLSAFYIPDAFGSASGAVRVFAFGAGSPPPILIGGYIDPQSPPRPSIATDGERFVVVWRSWHPNDYDVAGAVIDPVTFKVTPLSIAASSADEREPGVAAVAPGRFLITYTVSAEGERRLAARFLDFGETPARFRPSH
jgi:hypothetical protein